MPKRAGRPSVAQTPAPKSDKIYGSKKNPSGSATEKKSKSIKLSDKTIDTLKEKLDNFKKSHPNKKSIDLNDLKAVYRRGSGAYSKSHRPTITGGAPNSRAAWSYARVNKFLKKAGGAKVKAAYVQDDDLMAKGGKVYNDKELLAKYKKGESIGFTGEAHLKAKGLIPRADGTKRKSEKYMAKGGKLDETQIFILEHPDGIGKFAKGAKIPKGGDCYEAAGQFCMGSVYMPEQIEFVGEPHLVHAEVKGQGKAEGIRFGHAWVEDDENVYDYSNGRRIVMPKMVYYAIGDIRTENPEKYQKYTFPEARAKMLETKHYGSWDINTEYADGGLIAPNGKKSNLTPEQYKLVRTPQFKAWFGDWENDPENASKVVDENGEPMVVYHGSRKKAFTEFKNYYERKKKALPNDRVELHFFTNDRNAAKYYGTKNIYECFLSMKNPLYYKTSDGVPEEAIFQQNKDGFIMESSISSVFAVPKSNQIKLADGSNNKFDANNPDIRFADGGDVGGYKVYVNGEYRRTIKDEDLKNYYLDKGFQMNNGKLQIYGNDIAFEDGGMPSQHITCINCGWEWETADSAENDKYVCHQCGFDNSLFYDGGILKPTMPLDQIAEKHGVSLEYVEKELKKGIQHEKEHTDSDEVATSIALHHLAERPDYYEELEKIGLKDGGEVIISDEDYEFWIGGDENLGKAITKNGVLVGGIAYDEDNQEIKGILINKKFRRTVPESKPFWKNIGTDFDNYNEDAGLWEGYVNRYEDGGEIDLFEDIDSLPENVQAVLAKYSGADESYTNAEAMLAELEPLGYTFEYGLDALPFNLRQIDILEDNSDKELEIADFLKQQKEESQMVMTCDDSKIYKAMICKTKCEIADKRMSETENPEELNAWQAYKNIWEECMQSIVNNDLDKYKAGGKTCGCGCGSIYSKGGMFSKGGLAYGNSHDKGGMPMKVASTGQNIEIEGGEGVINKRSMQSSKKVEFQGQKMTPCEVVSKINQMGGGVKFKCQEVADIIAEDGNF